MRLIICKHYKSKIFDQSIFDQSIFGEKHSVQWHDNLTIMSCLFFACELLIGQKWQSCFFIPFHLHWWKRQDIIFSQVMVGLQHIHHLSNVKQVKEVIKTPFCSWKLACLNVTKHLYLLMKGFSFPKSYSFSLVPGGVVSLLLVCPGWPLRHGKCGLKLLRPI